MVKINLLRLVSKSMPDLPMKLKQANMAYSPEEFIKRTFSTAVMVGVMLTFIVFMFLANAVESAGKLILLLILIFPVLVLMMYSYFLRLPTVKIAKIKKMIDKEVIFAGRFLVVELESGVPLFNAIKNISKNFEVVGAYFQEIIEKVSVGTTLEKALSEAVDQVPSDSLRKIFWQISNSLSTGSNVAKPLTNVIETLIKEQQILVAEYGRKLNPLAMFYMLIAVVVPSLGITLLTIIIVFMGLSLSMPLLLAIVGMLGFMQFMFLAIIKSSRPAIEF